MKMIRVLSLGAGVQSTTLLLMSCLGELPLVDCAVFADTQWEPAEVYTHLEWLTEYAAKAGVPVHKVSQGNIRADGLAVAATGVNILRDKPIGKRWASMPLFTRDNENMNRIGMIRRQCTSEYKIKPLERFVRRELLGIQPKCCAPKDAVETWIGISADEIQRVRLSKSHWQTFRYPLITDVVPLRQRGLFKHGFHRSDCISWLTRNGFKVPPRSACIGCPFHNDEEWLRIKADPTQWADAVAFDRGIRKCGGMRGDCYLHRSCVSLDEVEFNPKKNWDGVSDNECIGMCGS